MIWRLKPQTSQEFFNQFPEHSPQALQLLFNRGLQTQEQIDEFFNPDYEQDLHDPFLMLGMEDAVKRILSAVKKGEKITIFSDYDADGVCGGVLLESTLRALGVKELETVIPDRNVEGYGLNCPAIEKVSREGAKLIISVDSGVSDVKEVELANSLGLDVIITDHHQVPEKLPPALVILNPHQKKDEYPFKYLAGAGVAFKLACALLKSFENDEGSEGQLATPEARRTFEKWLLDLVALATVADCMPLLGENRTLVKYGLYVLAKTRRLGLQELMKAARLSPTFAVDNIKTNLNAYALGFALAPRLNAAARVDHASLAYELLKSETRQEAVEWARRLDQCNRERQKMTEQIIGDVEARIAAQGGVDDIWVIVEADEKWIPGVVGLAASKISDKYHRPSIILNKDPERLRGSARSIENFNLVEALNQCREFLREYGGHPGAAGLTMSEEHLAAFREKINRIAKEKIQEKDLIPVLDVDMEIFPETIKWELFEELERFEPFGEANECPVFMVRNLEIVSLRQVGNGHKHLKLELKSAKLRGKIFKGIGFGLAGENNLGLSAGDAVDLAFELIVDEWNGHRSLQLRVIDIKKAETSEEIQIKEKTAVA